MVRKLRDLGRAKMGQVQPTGLILDTEQGSIYDPSRRVEVSRLDLTPLGIEAITPEGDRVLDIQHTAHPKTRCLGDDEVSIGFASHYAAMRVYFGGHMVDGIGGENIIIEYEEEVWLADLGGMIGLENSNTGRVRLL